MKLKIRNLLLIGLFLATLTNCNNNDSSLSTTNDSSPSISSSSDNKESSSNEEISSTEEVSSSEQHVHTYDEDYSYNDIYHFKECKGCQEIAFKEMHEFDNGVCTICYYVDENLAPKEFIPMNKYFNNAKYSFDRNDYVYDENDNQVEYNTLLDRQINIFTQDIMYRLSYIYGSNGTTHNRVQNSIFELKKDETNPYTCDNRVATVNGNTILTGIDLNDGIEDLSSALINNIKYFQNSISIFNIEKNCLLSPSALNLAGAIEGRNMRVIKNGDSYLLDNNINTSSQWIFGSGLKDSTYYSFTNKRNFNSFKMAMAQIMAGEDLVNGAYEVTEYNNLLDKIDNMQISIKYKDVLINFIKKYVIGINLVLSDDNYGAILNNSYDSMISKGNLDKINKTTLFNNFNVSVDSLRLYKGYSMVIPAIVTQALSNSFDAFNTNSLYPYLSRNNVEFKSIDEYRQTHENYKSVVLIPGIRVDETPFSEFGITLSTTEKYLNNVAYGSGDSFHEIIVNVTYVINDNVLGTDSKTVTLSYDETVSVVLFDANRFTNGKAFTKYQGTKNDCSNDRLFSNGFSATGNVNYDAGSYIKISFENKTKIPFNIYLNGYYE